MPKTRTLEPEFWDDKPMDALSISARLLAAAMITFLADDEGRFVAEPSVLKKKIFGAYPDISEDAVRGFLVEMSTKWRNLHLYENEGQLYGFLTNFARKQGIRYVVHSKLPPPTAKTSKPISGNEINECGNLRKLPENFGASRVDVVLNRIEEQGTSYPAADAAPPVVEEAVSPKDEAPAPDRPKTEQQIAVQAVFDLCEAAKFCEGVSGGRAAKWLAEFGLDLIRETLADGRIDFEGKSPNYLHGVLKTRKAKPGERPHVAPPIETFTRPAVQHEKTDEQRRAEYDFYRRLVDRFRAEHPELAPDDPRFEDAIYREKRVPWGYYLALEQELAVGETVQ